MCPDIFPGETSCGSSYSQTSREQPLSLRILGGYLQEVCLYHKWQGAHFRWMSITQKKPLVNTNLSTEAHVLLPRYGQYLTHAHHHITPAGAAMDSCFAVIGAHQHDLCSGKAVFRPLVSRASPGTQNPNKMKNNRKFGSQEK